MASATSIDISGYNNDSGVMQRRLCSGSGCDGSEGMCGVFVSAGMCVVVCMNTYT